MSNRVEFYKVLEELGSKKIKVAEAHSYLEAIIKNEFIEQTYGKGGRFYLSEEGLKEVNLMLEAVKDITTLRKNLETIEKKGTGGASTSFYIIKKTLLYSIEINERKEALLKKEKELKKREAELKKKERKTGKYKRSGHLQDQLLKYTYPKDKQPDLFSVLAEETIKDIEITGVERTQVVEGIKLSPAETKVIDTLCKLLHHSSHNLEPKKELYYTGNKEPYIEGETVAPRLGFTLYDFTKEYIGIDKKVGGKDIENVKKVLYDLNEKKFCIKYTEVTTAKNGEWIKKEYEKYRPIINIDKATLSLGKGDIVHYKETETVIVLHPIFRSQIDSKFIVYPDDITQRTILAYGSPNVSQITLNLREYLMREHSSKHFSPEIGLDRLYYLLAEKWMTESRKAKVKEYTEKALDVVTTIGLLESYEITTAKTTGEPKIIFKLNKKFE